MEPIDFELSLHAGNSDGNLKGVTAEIRLQLGDSEPFFGPFDLDLDPASLAPMLGDTSLYSASLTAAVLGKQGLFGAYIEARSRAAAASVPLRMRVRIPPNLPELHGIVWELLADPTNSLPLSLSEKVLFSRYLPPRVELAVGLPPLRGTLRALAAAANPSNLSAYQLARIDAQKELTRAEASLVPLRVDRLPQFPGDLCTLNRLLERGRSVDILYLACHGAYRRRASALFLEGEDGKVKRALGTDLASRIAQMDARPRLVVLASCESAGTTAGEALRALGPLIVEAGVPAVLAVQGPVSMATMDAFLPVLFRELAQDGRIDRAVAVARQAVHDAADWFAPVLYMNLLSGRLFEPEPASAARIVPAGTPHEVPSPPANFIGRAVELEGLKTAVENGAQVINIHGTNGVGRTATARELVHRIIDRYPDGQVNLDMQGAAAHTGLSSAVSPGQALAYVLQKFDPTIAQLPSDETLLAGRLRSILFGRKVLILLDNVADLAQVALFLPPPDGCLVLFTSWERFDSEEAEIYNCRLGKLPRADAEQLLAVLAPRAAARVGELAARCEYLPQALDGIARRLNKSPDLTVDDLLVLLDDLQERLEITGIAATLQVSYGMLTQDQQKNWRRLAVFAADFDVPAAAWVWARVDSSTLPDRLRSRIIRTRLDLADLLDYGLVEYDAVSDRYRLHNLSRAFIASLADWSEVEILAARLAHARVYLTYLRQANDLYMAGSQRILEGLALYDKEVQEIRSAWAWLQPSPPDNTQDRAFLELRAAYPTTFANLMALRLMPDERIVWLESGLQAARALEDRKTESSLLAFLGVAYYILDRFQDAMSCQMEALTAALAEARSPAGGCEGLVVALGNLGSLYRAGNKRPRAVRYLLKQIELARRSGFRREESRAFGTLGRTYLDLKDTDRARESYLRVLDITDETGDQRARAIALGGLGDVERVMKDFAHAVTYLEDDIAITRSIGDRRGQAIASWMLGKVYEDMGDLGKAVDWMRVLVDYEKEIGHQDAAWREEHVAELHAKLISE